MKKIVLVIIMIFSLLLVPCNTFASQDETVISIESSSETISNQVIDESEINNDSDSVKFIPTITYGDIILFFGLAILIGIIISICIFRRF